MPNRDPNISICLENLEAYTNKNQLDLSRIREKMDANKDIGFKYLEYAKSKKKTDHESVPNIHRIDSAKRNKDGSQEKTYVYGDGLGNKTKSQAHYPNYIRGKLFVFNVEIIRLLRSQILWQESNFWNKK